MVELGKPFHHQFANQAGGHFFAAGFIQALFDFVHGVFDGFGRNRAFVQGALQAGLQFERIEHNALAVVFDNLRHPQLYGFVGAEAAVAGRTTAAAADAVLFFQQAGVDYLGVVMVAEGAFHRLGVNILYNSSLLWVLYSNRRA